MKNMISLLMVVVFTLVFTFPVAVHAECSKGKNCSQANLTAQWWQWAFSIPDTTVSGEEGSIHPLVGDDDDFGDPELFEFCGNGQHGNVWFLGGDFSGSGEPFERTCMIPAGKTILMPVINWECSTAEGDATQGASAAQQGKELKECAESVGDFLGGTAFFGPKGGKLRAIKVARISTKSAFPVYFSPSNVIGLDEPPNPNPSLAQADGQWIMLRNLKPGYYRLEFTGVVDYPESPGIDFEINGAYNLVVARWNGEPPKQY